MDPVVQKVRVIAGRKRAQNHVISPAFPRRFSICFSQSPKHNNCPKMRPNCSKFREIEGHERLHRFGFLVPGTERHILRQRAGKMPPTSTGEYSAKTVTKRSRSIETKESTKSDPNRVFLGRHWLLLTDASNE